MESGIDVNVNDGIGFTALILASTYGRLEIIKYLVENGADVNKGKDHGSPLSHAVNPSSGELNLEVVTYLVENGADVNTTAINEMSGSAESVLMRANNLDTIKYLIDNGADINYSNEYESVLEHAIMLENKEKSDFLIESGADTSSVRLVDLVRINDLERVKESIKSGADINTISIIQYEMDSSPFTPLMLASDEGYLNIVEYLLENGADINITNEYGDTALSRAELNGHKEIVEYLLANGAEKSEEG